MNFKSPKYARLTTLPIDLVILAIKEQEGVRSNSRVELGGVMVKLSSLRLRCFANKGTICEYCKLPAQYFAVERSLADEEKGRPYHINLWGIGPDGEEVLFTHDHVLARALGGAPNDLENAVTSCGPCNWRKGLEEQKLVEKLSENNEQTD
jgi:hypothetical protein